VLRFLIIEGDFMGFFKKLFNQDKSSKIVKIDCFAPVSGNIIDITSVKDEVFAGKMMGDGMAISPSSFQVCSPFDGKIITLHSSKHAIVIQHSSGVEMLIHIGLETVALKGAGFKSLVVEGQTVKANTPLIEFDNSYITKNAKSNVVICVITNNANLNIVKYGNGDVKVSENKFMYLSNTENGEQIDNNKNVDLKTTLDDGEYLSEFVTIMNHTGIHARPASHIFNIANKYSGDIFILLNNKQASAKSVVGIMGLSIGYGDKIQIKGIGLSSKSVVDEIMEACKNGLGEEVKKNNVSSTTNSFDNNEKHEKQKVVKKINPDEELTFKGVIACSGVVVGNIFKMVEEEIDIEEESLNPRVEEDVLAKAIHKVVKDLENEILEAKAKKQKSKAEIFQAHLMLVKDPSLLMDAKNIIKDNKTAAFGWRKAIQKAIHVLKSTHNPLLIERIADFKDLEKRIIMAILGMDNIAMKFSKNTIIVAEDLIPSNILEFDENVVGIILAKGSATSHVSIMIKNIGIPTIVAVGMEVLQFKNNTNAILNTDSLSIKINPSKNEVEKIIKEVENIKKIKETNLKDCKKPAITTDSVSITVKGNIGNLQESETAFVNGAEGIGLLRTEFLFFNSKNAPTEDEQYEMYQSIINSVKGNAVTIRTLDVGGDKPLSYVKMPIEENPILGKRGVRNYFDNIKLFRSQIRALLRVKPLEMCYIMIPMITFIQEIFAVKNIIEEEKKNLGISLDVKFGIMIEVPAAAIMAEQFAKYVDFFSIGTNDLAQYTLAMDRGNPDLASQISNLNPSLLRMIKLTVEGGNKHGKVTSVCGAMASEIEAIPLLVGLGVKELSVSRSLIPDVKALIRTLKYSECVEAVEIALNMEKVEDVRNLMRSKFNL
jgi:phosphoenolpyruvate-protein phosphotransferase